MSTVLNKLMTLDEFLELPDPTDGSKLELIRGEVFTVPPAQPDHGIVCLRIGWILMNFIDPQKLGWAMSNDSGVYIEQDPDTLVGPDIGFWSIRRVPTRPKKYLTIPPDLAVEVLSPSDSRSQVREKIKLYFENDVPLVWLADLETHTVTVYAGSHSVTELDPSDTIDGGTVLPGFSCQVAKFFE